MSLQFILGRSGSGKSRYCIEAVAERLGSGGGDKLIVLVPEQATYQVQQAVLNVAGVSGYSSMPDGGGSGGQLSSLEVLSFDRLEFLLTEANCTKRRINAIGREMIIARILLENSSRLKIFGNSARLSGFASKAAETISQLNQYAKSEQDIEELLEGLGEEESISAFKYADIGLILAEYNKFIQGRFLDPQVQLNSVRGAVAKSELLAGAMLWVDGFSGFTDSELAVLIEMLKVVDSAQIALCLDSGQFDLSGGDVGLFEPTCRTYRKLLDIAKKSKLTVDKPVILDKPLRFGGGGLEHIERDLFNPGAKKLACDGSVRVFRAGDIRGEVKNTARQIECLVREGAVRYRDIAVITPDINKYEHYIRAYFADHRIPFFIDKPRGLISHPGLRFILSALSVCTGQVTNEGIFAYLKSGFSGIAIEDIDSLENYCIAFGIKGSDWVSSQGWDYAGDNDTRFDNARVDGVRRAVVKQLDELRGSFKLASGEAGKLGADEFTRVLFGFLEGMDFGEQLSGMAQRAEARGHGDRADEYKQLYELVVDLFDELCEAFAGVELGAGEFYSILSSSFSKLSLVVIPPGLDQVVVGSVERSRHPDIKAAILLGTTQSQFPMPMSSRGVLTDSDIDAASVKGFELDSSVDTDLMQRRYLGYIAFTRPGQYLYISYPAVDGKGRAIVRSQFVDDLAELFDGLEEESVAGVGSDESDFEKLIDQAYTVDEFADVLCSGYLDGRIDANFAGLLESEGFCSIAATMKAAASYSNDASLSKNICESLYGDKIYGSATRLGTFADCPYKYFARYVLKLEERKEFRLEPVDLGVIYHRTLERFVNNLMAEGRILRSLTDDEVKRFIEGSISAVLAEDSYLNGFCRHSSHNMYILANVCEVLVDFAKGLREISAGGGFEPVLTEAGFGSDKDKLGVCEIDVGGGVTLCLRGKIDRIDSASFDGQEAFVVYDYKKNKNAKFGWGSFYYGQDMQLGIYLLAAMNSERFGKSLAAGAFLLPVDRKVEKGSLSDIEKNKEKFWYKGRGVLRGELAGLLDSNASGYSRYYNYFVKKDGDVYGNYGTSGALKPDDFEAVIKYTQAKAVIIAKSIMSGNIEVHPVRQGASGKACDRCPYISVCRFDRRINNFNDLLTLGKKAVLERIGGADE